MPGHYKKMLALQPMGARVLLKPYNETPSYLPLYSLWANGEHSPAMWLIYSLALLHNLHFELTARFSSFVIIAVVCTSWSWATDKNPFVSFLNYPFFNHTQEYLWHLLCAFKNDHAILPVRHSLIIPLLLILKRVTYSFRLQNVAGSLYQHFLTLVNILIQTQLFHVDTIRCTNQPTPPFLPRKVMYLLEY